MEWYKNSIFYEVYIRGYHDSNGDGHGDINGLIQKLDYLKDLGVDCIWLLPFYPSPLRDDGYDIADFYNVIPEYGNLDDVKSLVNAAHQRKLRLITDLVINHTSDKHPWFQSARNDKLSPYRDYYVWSDSDQNYRDARIIFLDSEISNWTWDEAAGQYFWHRFYSSQPDLNFDNPNVREEIFRIIKFWLEMGIDGFRVDAVPYLFEREGTNCENLPETHAFLKTIRCFIDENYPGRVLLCEANQWPEDVRNYFGDGDEFHMGFHFPLMPRIFMALKKGDRSPIEWVLERTPAIPEGCQWCTFLRNHDELTLEMVSPDERDWMWEKYAPDTRMRLNQGIRRRLAPLLDGDLRLIELAYSLLFTLPGSPTIYYGDEIGMGDNILLPDRNGVRTPMQWNGTINGGFSYADPQFLYSPVISEGRFNTNLVNVQNQLSSPDSLLSRIRLLIKARKKHPVLSSGELVWLHEVPHDVAAYMRTDQNEQLLIVNNLSHSSISVPINTNLIKSSWIKDILKDDLSAKDTKLEVVDPGKYLLELEPYEYKWFKV